MLEVVSVFMEFADCCGQCEKLEGVCPGCWWC